MDSIISGIQDLISNPLSTPVGQLLEKATSGDEPSENWAMYMEVCDVINETEDGPKDAIRAVKKLLSNNVGKNNVVVLYTITVLETCVKNCGRRFHIQIAQKDFMQELVKIVTNRTNPVIVTDKVLSVMQTWADAFQGCEELREVTRVVQELKEKGFEFPMTDLDMVAPIHTPARSQPASVPPAAPPVRPQPPQQKVEAPNTGDDLDQELLDFDDVPVNALDFNVPPPVLTSEAMSLNEEQMKKLHSDLSIVSQNCRVMGEMLNELIPGQETAEDWLLLQDLNRACQHMQHRIMGLIQQVQNEEVTDELLRMNDETNNVLLRYERFERLRAGLLGQQQTTSAGDSRQSGTAGSATDTLIDIGDSTAPGGQAGKTPELAPLNGTSTAQTGPSSTSKGSAQVNASAADFDMFAQSRESYEKSQQALRQHQDAYSREDDDALLSGLGTAMNLKSQVNPYKIDDENDLKEMEEWTKANTLVARNRQQATSATSSEFDQFLAARATTTGGESEPLISTSAAGETGPSPRANHATNRTIKKADDDDSMFSL